MVTFILHDYQNTCGLNIKAWGQAIIKLSLLQTEFVYLI